ncbi:MAG: hypothetical protein Tsb0033_17260 [Winogradskyella sp.]
MKKELLIILKDIAAFFLSIIVPIVIFWYDVFMFVRKHIKELILSTCVLIFMFQFEVLMYIYKDAKTDYNVFLDYYYTKERVNEFLYTLMFFVLFLYSKKRINKAITVFGFVMTSSSMVDKILLNNYGYMYSDIVILCIAAFVSVKIYYNGKNTARTERPTDKDNNT